MSHSFTFFLVRSPVDPMLINRPQINIIIDNYIAGRGEGLHVSESFNQANLYMLEFWNYCTRYPDLRLKCHVNQVDSGLDIGHSRVIFQPILGAHFDKSHLSASITLNPKVAQNTHLKYRRQLRFEPQLRLQTGNSAAVDIFHMESNTGNTFSNQL